MSTVQYTCNGRHQSNTLCTQPSPINWVPLFLSLAALLIIVEISGLTLSILGKTFSKRHFEIFFLFFFFRKTGFDISCKLSPLETFSWHVKTCFLGKNKKIIIYLSSAELAKGVVKVKHDHVCVCVCVCVCECACVRACVRVCVCMLFNITPKQQVLCNNIIVNIDISSGYGRKIRLKVSLINREPMIKTEDSNSKDLVSIWSTLHFTYQES